MAGIFLGLGSNIERERHLAAGLDALRELLGELRLSPVYDCPAIGFDGQPFLNMVVGAETGLSVEALAVILRRLETSHGRSAAPPRCGPRRLDIDILIYGDLVGRFGTVQLPRPEILQNAFVLRPLAELAPDARHPVTGRRFADLWAEFDRCAQPIARVAFNWRGREIA